MTDNSFQLADITTPIPSGRKRLILHTSIAGGDGDTEVLAVKDGSCWDVNDGYAAALIASGAAVPFEPATVMAFLMKTVGVAGVNLTTDPIPGFAAALRKAKVTVHR